MTATNAPQAQRPGDADAAHEPASADAEGLQPLPASKAVQDQQQLQSEIDAEDAQMRHESAM